MTSFLKYQEDRQVVKGNGRGPLAFGRAHLDGAPFRGPALPLRDEEYQDYTEEVLDFDMGIFDIRVPEEYARVREIFDRAANNWYRIVDYDKQWEEREDGTKTVIVFVSWVVPHRELAKSRVQANLIPDPVPTFGNANRP